MKSAIFIGCIIIARCAATNTEVYNDIKEIVALFAILFASLDVYEFIKRHDNDSQSN